MGRSAMRAALFPVMAKKKKNKKQPVRPVVFAGTRNILMAQVAYVQEVLDALKGNVFITGGAPGIDQFVYGQLEMRFPKARHIVVMPYGYPPQDVHEAGVRKNPRAELIRMERSRSSRHPNLLRNDYMCELAMELNPERAKLVAFPGGPIEQQRSGTWSCVRSARRLGLDVEIYPLSSALGMSDGGTFESTVQLNPAYTKVRRKKN